jgi:hypothetical protein
MKENCFTRRDLKCHQQVGMLQVWRVVGRGLFKVVDSHQLRYESEVMIHSILWRFTAPILQLPRENNTSRMYEMPKDINAAQLSDHISHMPQHRRATWYFGSFVYMMARRSSSEIYIHRPVRIVQQ